MSYEKLKGRWMLTIAGIALSVAMMGCSSAVGLPILPTKVAQVLPTAQAKIAGQTITLEVARTPQQQARGLMYRTALADDRGMVFPFDPPQPVGFWMKNVPISLDIIFVRNGRVEAIAANSPPCTRTPCPVYPSGVAIDQVIELRGGRAAELRLKVGDSVSVQPPSPVKP